MSKIFKTGLATAAAMASLVTLAPMAAQAQANYEATGQWYI